MPRYNVAPRTYVPIIRRAQPEEPALIMHSMRWGLVPHWSKAEPLTVSMINVRAKNLRGMWERIKVRNRCIVIAQGCVHHPVRTVHGNIHIRVYLRKPAGTTNGSKKARSSFHILHGIKINGSCCSPGCMIRSLSKVHWLHATSR